MVAGLMYYTTACVGLRDNSLRIAWNVGLIGVIVWTFFGLFWEKGYLQHFPVTIGVARMKVDQREGTGVEPYMVTHHYGDWYFEDLVHQEGGAEIFIVTKVKEEMYMHHESSSRDLKHEVFHVGVQHKQNGTGMLESFKIIGHDHPKAIGGGGTVLDGQFLSTKEMHGVLKRADVKGLGLCGTIWGHQASEVHHGPGVRDEVLLVDLLCAAGIDADNTTRVGEVLREGITLLLSYVYKQSDSYGVTSHFWSRVPVEYDLTVTALPAQAKMRRVERVWGSKSSRLRTSMKGITVQVQRGGSIAVWSWNNLIEVIVIKTGLFGLLTSILDLYWIYIMPALGGRDYNDLVFKEVGTDWGPSRIPRAKRD